MISVDLYNMDTEPLWGYASENNGWKIVLDYISTHK